MAGLPKTALSRAAEIIAAQLHDAFSDVEPKLNVLVGTPNAAHGKAKNPGNADHYLNLFFYRISQSGFHAATGPNDELLLRLHCLVTPFAKIDNQGDPNPDLELLGATIRYFHSQKLLALPVGDDVGRLYCIESTLLHPNMEEMNHIWTTQGSEADYRLSAVYEFSLVPVSPLERRPPAPLVSNPLLAVSPALDPTDPFTMVWGNAPPRHNGRLPILMLRDGALLTNRLTVPAGQTRLPLALAGDVGQQATIDLAFDDAADKEIEGQGLSKVEPVVGASVDADGAALDLDFNWPDRAMRVRVRARPGNVPPGGAHGNTVIASRSR